MKYSHDALTNAVKQCVENNMPVRKSAKLFNVPRTTLRDRLSGRVQIDTITTKLPLFTMLEEAKLVDHLNTMADYGYGYTRQETVNLASDLAVQLGKRKKEDPLSLKWIRGFLQRWPELRVVKPRGLEYARAKMTSTKIVDAYFENLQQCLIKHSLTDKPHLIFNLDEKRVTTEHRPPHIIGSSAHCPPAITSERGKTVTILGCISASGMAIPPFFVFPGKRMNHKLLNGKSPGADGDVSDSGWSNHAIFRRYLTDHFIKYIPGRGDQKVLLMLDGHKSHVSVGLCEWARENGIIFFFLPPHTSHFLQPLDVSCYGPFERMFNAECHKMMGQTASVLNRFNVCEISCRVYSKALSPDNAQSAFRRTGIYPLNKSIIPSESLLPAEVYQTSQNVEAETDDSQATVEGGIPEDTSVPPDEEVTDIFEIEKKNRFPNCVISGELQSLPWTWKSLYPVSIECDKKETYECDKKETYDVFDWLCLRTNRLIKEKEELGAVSDHHDTRTKLTKILKPLEHLYFNDEKKSWAYKEKCELTLTEQTITQGFVANLANSRGRGMVSEILSQSFATESHLKVVNIGGSSTVNEPSVRKITFKGSVIINQSSSTASSVSEQQYPWASRATEPKETHSRHTDSLIHVNRFVPDVIVESVDKEHLLVEIKQGLIIHPEYLNKLKFMLIPAAVKQGKSLGLIICAKAAVVMTCTAADQKVMFNMTFHELRSSSLLPDMIDLMTETISHIQ